MGCLPVTSKCCFFIPLRPGLLVWAYIKLCAAVALLVYMCIAYFYGKFSDTDRYIFFSALVGLSVVSVVLSELFVIGLHTKNYKMILVFYWYSMLELLITIGLSAWQIYEITIYSAWQRHSLLYIISRQVVGILLPMYYIIVIRSELLAIKGKGEQPATTADDEPRVVLDAPVVKQDQRYHFVYSSPEFEHKVNNTSPLFPVEELRMERLRQELEQ